MRSTACSRFLRILSFRASSFSKSGVSSSDGWQGQASQTVVGKKKESSTEALTGREMQEAQRDRKRQKETHRKAQKETHTQKETERHRKTHTHTQKETERQRKRHHNTHSAIVKQGFRFWD